MTALDAAVEVLEQAEDAIEMPLMPRHRITVDDYYLMAEAGILKPDAQVELIEGEVIDMDGANGHAAFIDLSGLL